MEALEAAISALSVRDSRGFFEHRGYRASVYPLDTRCRSVIIYANSMGRILVPLSTQ